MMKKLLRSMLVLVFLMATLFCMTSIANAADTFTNLKEVHVGETAPVKCGDYYFAYDGMDGGTLMGTSKSKINKTTPLPADFLCDGEKAFYIDFSNYKLYCYNLSERKRTSLKNLSSYADKGYSLNLAAGYKKFLYVTMDDYDACTFYTYCFNRTEKKWKRVSKTDTVTAMKNGYAVTNKRFHQDVSPEYYTLRKINKDGGFTKVKVLTKAGLSPTFIGSKLYYVYYPNQYEMNKAVLKRCNKNGEDVETVKTFKTEEYGFIYIYNITSKSCYVYKNDQLYKYTYKTDKLTKVNA